MSPEPRARTQLAALIRIGAVRWNNRLAAFATRRRRDESRPGRSRTGTGRKGSFSIGLLVVLFFPLLLWQALMIGTMTLNRVTQATRVAEAFAADESTILLSRRDYRRLEDEQHDLDQQRARSDDPELIAAKLADCLEDLDRRLDLDEFAYTGAEGSRAQRSVSDEERRAEVFERFERLGAAGFVAAEARIQLAPRRGAWQAGPATRNAQHVLALLFALMFFGFTCFSLATKNQDLGRVNWSFEWLFSFPARASTLFVAKLFEYALVNPIGWIGFGPFTFVLLYSGGLQLLAALAGALCATFGLNLLVGAAQLLLETWLRLRLPLARVKNIQAGCTLLGILALYAVLAFAVSQSPPAWLFDLVERVPGLFEWLPTALPALLAHPAGLAAPIAVGLTLAAAFVLGSVALSAHLVRRGLVCSAAPAAGERGLAAARRRSASDSRLRLRGLFGRELRLLLRDRTFLVQTILVPLLIIGFQIVINPALLGAAGEDFRHAATLAFGISAYVTLAVSTTILSAEGQALWLLYTFPEPLESIFRRKVRLWVLLGLAYATAIMLLVGSPGPTLSDLAHALLALGGVWIFAYVAAGLGMLGSDPFESEPQRRIRPGILYLMMLLASGYGLALHTPIWFQKPAPIVLTAAVAYAIWETVRERIPFLLDPVARPRPRIMLGHGLIAALAFFVAHALIGLTIGITKLSSLDGPGPSPADVTWSYAIAGLLVGVTTVAVLVRSGIADLPTELGLRRAPGGPSTLRALAEGLVAGGLAALVAGLYLLAVQERTWFQEIVETSRMMGFDGGSIGVVILGVICAPLVEELIFRGLVFHGLQHRLSPFAAALASAALFALVHPFVSWLPVFGLGLATAAVYQRTRLLAAPIVCHALYNALVL